MNDHINLFVGFVPQTSDLQKHQLHNKLGVKRTVTFSEIDVEVIEVNKKDIQQVIKKYQSSSHVAFIEEMTAYAEDFQTYLFREQSEHGSKYRLQNQWGFKRVDLEPAWEAARHIKEKVTIAILDTGIDPDHPDLSSKIIQPINFTSKKRDDFRDVNGHGTHVAGIAAAVTNNKISRSGSRVKTANIMPIKVIGSNGGQTNWIIAGILYAVLNGAKVINISVAARSFSMALQRAINYAWQKGAVIVAAAGNEKRESVKYPAGYNYVLAVSATNEDNQPAGFSNWGINIGITAPGTGILSTTPTYSTPNRLRTYDLSQGTSQATPFVSGLAALLFAIDPDLSNTEVIQIIQRAAIPIQEGKKQWNAYSGYGLINAANAINRTIGKSVRTAYKGSRLTSNGRTSRRHPSRGRNDGQTSQRSKGSFYGQLVDEFDHPIANAMVSARMEGKIVSMYKTRSNVPMESSGSGTDGMFRLPNLLPGKYSIFVELPGQTAFQVGSYTILGGADTILRLVCKK